MIGVQVDGGEAKSPKIKEERILSLIMFNCPNVSI